MMKEGSASDSSQKRTPERREVTKDYDFVLANAEDYEEIVDLTLNHYFAIEPHCVAFGITAENAGEFIKDIVAKSLKFPFSYRVVHKATGKLVGVRMMTTCERDDKDDSVDVDVEKLDEGIQIFGGILLRLKPKIWVCRPNVYKVLRRELSFVHKDHQRRGIAQKMLNIGLDFNSLRTSGIDGIVSEASSIANQTLLLKNGFEEIARAHADEYFRPNGEPVLLPDGTSTVKLLYLSLN